MDIVNLIKSISVINIIIMIVIIIAGLTGIIQLFRLISDKIKIANATIYKKQSLFKRISIGFLVVLQIIVGLLIPVIIMSIVMFVLSLFLEDNNIIIATSLITGFGGPIIFSFLYFYFKEYRKSNY
jgi:hypothetical protein